MVMSKASAAWEPDGDIGWTETTSVAAALGAWQAEMQRQNGVERSRLGTTRRDAEQTGCRRSFLLSYFGQDYCGPCGSCDNDLARPEAAHTDVPFAVGVRIWSERWGEGAVQRRDGDQATMLFDEHGYRDLLVSLVLEPGLLRSSSSAG